MAIAPTTVEPIQAELFHGATSTRWSDIGQHILPTNATTSQYAFHRWFNFVAGFSPEFVDQCLSGAAASSDTLIVDPFAGCGTSLVEANLQGVRSVGYDPHPFIAQICRAKLSVGADPQLITRIGNDLRRVRSGPQLVETLPPPARKFLVSLFPSDVLPTLLAARQTVGGYRDEMALFGFLILSRVLELTSHSKTDGIYKAPSSERKGTPYEEALASTCEIVSTDLKMARHTGLTNRSRLIEQSSEQMDEVVPHSVDLMVTSPPYLNNFDFAEMTRMQLYFWGMASSWSEITNTVRSKLIVNTTTALKGHKTKMPHYVATTPPNVRDELNGYVELLQEKRAEKAGKKEYDWLVYPYFSQMTSVLTATHLALREGAPAHIIVSDAALYGVYINTPDVLASIMRTIGYTEVSVKLLRKRGHRWVLAKREGSPTGLGEYHITAIA